MSGAGPSKMWIASSDPVRHAEPRRGCSCEHRAEQRERRAGIAERELLEGGGASHGIDGPQLGETRAFARPPRSR